MGFEAKRAERHGLRAEAAQDGVERFDLFDSDGRARNSLQEVAEKHRSLMFRQLLEGGVFSFFWSTYVRMQPAHNFGRIRVELGAFAKAVQACVPKLARCAGDSGRVHAKVVRKQILKAFLAGIIG